MLSHIHSGAELLAVVLLLMGVGIFFGGTANWEHSVLAPLGMTLVQTGVLCFYWTPWRYARHPSARKERPVVASGFLLVSLAIIGISGNALLTFNTPIIRWAPFLTVHLTANLALACRPPVYARWMLGVWTVGLLSIGGVVVFEQTLHVIAPGLPGFILVLTGPYQHPLDSLAPTVFWLCGTGALIGTIAGAFFAWWWYGRRLRDDAAALRSAAPMA